MATHMTEEQLREHLYHDLQTSGVLDSMKSQLRQRLARELHKSVNNSPIRCNGRTLSDRICAGLVVDYLKTAGFEYTLSVFLPEADMTPDKLYSMTDLVEYLRVPASSVLYNKLLPAGQDESLLNQLLNALVHTPSEQLPETPHTTPTPSLTVTEQLHALDQSYARKADEENAKSQRNVEERLLCYQRDLEARHKHQLDTELSLYKSRELVKVRGEERDKYQRELAAVKLEATVAHQKQVQELRKLEQQMLERYRKKEQDLEAGIYSQRQSLLGQLRALKVSECELQRQSDCNNRAAQLEEERLAKLDHQLSGREKALDNIRTHYETIAEQKANKYKLELESELQSRQTELSQREAKLQKDHDKASSLHTDLTTLSTEVQTERDKADKLQSLLHDMMGKQLTLQGHKDALQQRLDKMSDYELLQKRSLELAQEVENAEKKLLTYKHRNSDNQRVIRELQSNIPRPTRELEALKKELDDIRRVRHKEMVTMETNNRELRRQLVAQSEYCVALQKKLDDQMVELLSAQREVQGVHSLLEQLRTAGTNVKPRVHPRSVPPASVMHPGRVPPASVMHPGRVPPASVLHPGRTLTSHQEEEPLTVPSNQLLEESRASIARLEKEAQELEATCLNLTSPFLQPDATLLTSTQHPYTVTSTPPLTAATPRPTAHREPASPTYSQSSTSAATTSHASPLIFTATTSHASPPTFTVPPHTPLESTSAPLAPKVALDELWKSSQDKRQSTTTNSVPILPLPTQATAKPLEVKPETPPPTHSNTDPPTHSNTDPPTHSNTDPPTHSIVEPPTRSIVSIVDPPTHSIVKPTTHSNVEPPTHSSDDPPTHSIVEPPTHSDDDVDSVMLKYMELVQQNRDSGTVTHVALTDNKLDEFGVPSLSHRSDSYGGFSDKDDDPFDDW